MAGKLPKDIDVLLSKLYDKDIPDVKNPRRLILGLPVLFIYNAKYKSTLPYWDALPNSIIIGHYPNGFLGINLHYIPWAKRINLANRLLKSVKNKNRINYRDIQKAWIGAKLPVGLAYLAIRRYLYSHIKSNIKQFDWETYKLVVREIPPKFQKQSQEAVYKDIMSQFFEHKKKTKTNKKK